MVRFSFVVFFSVVLLVYGGLCWYLARRLRWLAPGSSRGRRTITVLFVFLASAFLAGRLLEKFWLSWLSDLLVWTGAVWLAVFFYLLLGLLAADLLRLGSRLAGWWPAAGSPPDLLIRCRTVAGILLAALLVTAAGAWNAAHPRLVKLRLEVAKAAGERKQLRVALISDIHLGTLIGNGAVRRLTETLAAEKPDVILLAGDVVDEDLAPVIRLDLGHQLRALRAPLGVFAICGNHEYIGGAGEAVRYLEEHGITVLRDRSLLLAGPVYLAGRDDRSRGRFTGTPRAPLDRVLAGVDRRFPVILLDHQPFMLEEARRAGVDVQLSGHTHHGQLWPLNAVTGLIYEISRGYGRRGGTHYFVSCGYGTWGPPVRTGNRPEIVILDLVFTG